MIVLFLHTTQMNIIFLDIDGVLNSYRYEDYLLYNNKSCFDENGAIFDPICVEALKRLILTTKAKIVISSSWKDNRICKNAYSILKKMWKNRNLPGEILDVTPTLTPNWLLKKYGLKNTTAWKGYEIDQWLKSSTQSHSYIIIDDEDIVLDYQRPFFIMTDGYNGLSDADVEIGIRIFNSPSYTQFNNIIL